MQTFGKRVREIYRASSKGVLTLYLVLRVLVLLCLVRQAMNGNWFDVALCLMTLVLLMLPVIVEDAFKVDLPQILECAVLLFVFSAEILGEIANFYENIPIWDTVLHTITGFLAASVGFSLVDLLNRHSRNNHLTPLFVTLVAFCFSMTVGVVWEFFEYGCDRAVHTDMQKDHVVQDIYTVELDPDRSNDVVAVTGIDRTVMYDENGNVLTVIEGGALDIGIIDTMKDMFVNMIGAAVFSVFGFLYITRRDRYGFIGRLLIRPKRSE